MVYLQISLGNTNISLAELGTIKDEIVMRDFSSWKMFFTFKEFAN